MFKFLDLFIVTKEIISKLLGRPKEYNLFSSPHPLPTFLAKIDIFHYE